MLSKKLIILQRLYDFGAFAVVRADVERAEEIANGLIAGGIPAMEISYTRNDAGETISYLKKKYQEKLLVGAGTVLDSETARLAILSGADFIISPNFDEAVGKMCNRYQIPYAPGCTTLTECVDAMSMGASFIKSFPISNFYGPSLVQIFKTPLPDMPIMASGGVDCKTISEWLEKGVDLCGIGSSLTKGTTEEIKENAIKIKLEIDKYRKRKV